MLFFAFKVKYAYTYCPHCNLCWPDDGETASKSNLPLYLGKVKLLLDFLSEEEEATAISEIDKIQWMPSQSGRNKQVKLLFSFANEFPAIILVNSANE